MNKKIFASIKYELILFFILCIQLMINIPTLEIMYTKGFWRTTPYVLTYDLGIKSRFFIGSIISLFTSKVTANIIYVLTLVITVILFACLSRFLAKAIKRIQDDLKDVIILLVFLFMAVSTNYTSFINPYNYAVFDIYLLLLTLLMIYIIKLKYIRFLIPLLCLICMAIHEEGREQNHKHHWVKNQ